MKEIPTLCTRAAGSEGAAINELKHSLETLMTLEETEEQQRIDITVPAFAPEYGSLHPTHTIMEEMVQIFRDLSFEYVDGPEIVTEEQNFDNLNLGPDHPARDGLKTVLSRHQAPPLVPTLLPSK
jgi:phenylalanyl-tRNA synthetase alpha chain